MSKPEDIPQSVWDEAFDHMDCHCPEAMMGDDGLQQAVHAAIARAIIAEGEACANEAESCADEKNAHPEFNFGCWTAADLIRMRSHVNTVSKISEEV